MSMYKTILCGIGVWFAITLSFKVKAETRTYQAPNGQIIGSSFTMGNMTFYQDKTGKPVGSATTMDNYTFYSAPDGRLLGNSYTMPNGNQTQSQPNPFLGGNNGR